MRGELYTTSRNKQLQSNIRVSTEPAKVVAMATNETDVQNLIIILYLRIS